MPKGPILKATSKAATAARLLSSESVARVWLRQGVQPPKRVGEPSGWGKALWKTSMVLMQRVKTGFEPFRHFVTEKFIHRLYYP